MVVVEFVFFFFFAATNLRYTRMMGKNKLRFHEPRDSLRSMRVLDGFIYTRRRVHFAKKKKNVESYTKQIV